MSVQYCTWIEISAAETEDDERTHGFNIKVELRVNVPSFSYIKDCNKEEETNIFFHVCDRRSSNSSKGKLGYVLGKIRSKQK